MNPESTFTHSLTAVSKHGFLKGYTAFIIKDLMRLRTWRYYMSYRTYLMKNGGGCAFKNAVVYFDSRYVTSQLLQTRQENKLSCSHRVL